MQCSAYLGIPQTSERPLDHCVGSFDSLHGHADGLLDVVS